MNICVVGAGYVGLTTAAVLAELGHNVRCIDRVASKIANLNEGGMPIYEPGLKDWTSRAIKKRLLSFGTDIRSSIAESPAVILAVGTPSRRDGSADMSFLEAAVADIAASIHSYKLIMVKSTVPPGTGDWIESRLLEYGVPAESFDVVSNPEFLREGTALIDTLQPDRIVIGSNRKEASDAVRALYRNIETEYVITDRVGAELIKYASNAFLAAKISFINEIAQVCEAFGADVTKVAKGIGLDQRIGHRFLQAGLGYGGSCLPKDLDALRHAAGQKGVKLQILRAARAVNRAQPNLYVHKLKQAMGEATGQPLIAVWGAAFKENTDDIRNSQAIVFIKKLVREGWKVKAYDPLVSPEIAGVSWAESLYDAVQEADALVLATGWEEFLSADWQQVSAGMRGDIVLDGRNRLNSAAVEAAGLRYVGVGRL
ncbi:UDP-glucose/GDP-mannose dehydrogenase family protein [Paenibacillus pasadenensis]|uniref:UDP-glucose dehydrogenase family protein n=1 Tax=Paenibacillus pasadenensis TaxID=217090 RepID=UPI00203F8075|nr:UDP-glucose/GDP-mannose dehydrogenase family protein [Paenibacillus pasadenensis]MCM3746827.1 UDP-glucose/GDP-mannose dehydrogenase family protein [Paenibacillus pasadenensis]